MILKMPEFYVPTNVHNMPLHKKKPLRHDQTNIVFCSLK